MSDDASLSEHEQRVLEEIERNLLEEDSDFVKRVRDAAPRKDSVRLLRFSVVGLIIGLGCMLAFTYNLTLGIVGFALMLLSAVGTGVAVRQLASGGRTPGTIMQDLVRRAETKMRQRRPRP